MQTDVPFLFYFRPLSMYLYKIVPSVHSWIHLWRSNSKWISWRKIWSLRSLNRYERLIRNYFVIHWKQRSRVIRLCFFPMRNSVSFESIDLTLLSFSIFWIFHFSCIVFISYFLCFLLSSPICQLYHLLWIHSAFF